MSERISIDTPDVYRPNEEPQSYRIHTVDELEDSLGNAWMRPAAATAEKLEIDRYGIDPRQDPEGFLANHNAVLDELEDGLNERLPAVKEKVITRTAAYFHGDNEAARDAMEANLRQRLAATERVIGMSRMSTAHGLTKRLSRTFGSQLFQPKRNVTSMVKQYLRCLKLYLPGFAIGQC